MMSDPLVFIIIVNWNGKQDTCACLESLSKISYVNHRIIVVDNASTDDSVNAVRDAYHDVVVLEMARNLRFAGGNNAGIRHALEHGAELLMLLNNDTTVHPEFLTHMVNSLRTGPDIGMVAPKIYYHDNPHTIWFAGGRVSMWTGSMSHIGIREVDNGQFDRPREIEYASGCCILTSKQVIERVGLLDESYHMYTEDADWSTRVRRAGYAIMFEPKAMVWHKLSVSAGGHLSWYKMKNKFLSNLRYFARYASWYHWLVFPWMTIMANAYAGLRYLIRPRD
jgi:hypothetical protein